MTARQRRDGWPWVAGRPTTTPHPVDLDESRALVNATALEVARLTEELRLALRRLEEAQVEARVASECIAARDAVQAIARARRID
jgi:hypothetical protein